MSYFPTDIPFMSEEELRGGIKLMPTIVEAEGEE